MAKEFLDVNKQIIDAIFALEDVEDIDKSVNKIIDDYGIEKHEKKKTKKETKSKKEKKEETETPIRKIIIKRL